MFLELFENRAIFHFLHVFADFNANFWEIVRSLGDSKILMTFCATLYLWRRVKSCSDSALFSVPKFKFPFWFANFKLQISNCADFVERERRDEFR